MKLSKKERKIAKRPRSIDTTHKHLYSTGNKNVDSVIHSAVKQFVMDCTTSFSQIVLPENCSMSKEQVLEHLISHLEKNHKELNAYFSSPDLLFRHLAYLSTYSHKAYEAFFKLTLRLTDPDIVSCACESVYLLLSDPHLSQNSIEKIISYRVGIEYSIVQTALNSKVEKLFSSKIQQYLKMYEVTPNNSLFELCQKRAKFLSKYNRF